MILVDTSVWIAHLRSGLRELAAVLDADLALVHPLVLGELACGNLARRGEVLALMRDLPALPRADDTEVLYFIERNRLMGLGIGYVDAHLLAATALAPPTRLWTRDKRLRTVADDMDLVYQTST